MNYLEKKSIAYITWGRCNKNSSEYSWIDEDIEYGSTLAVNYLLSKGHENIGYLSSSIKTNYFVQRKLVYSVKVDRPQVDDLHHIPGKNASRFLLTHQN